MYICILCRMQALQRERMRDCCNCLGIAVRISTEPFSCSLRNKRLRCIQRWAFISWFRLLLNRRFRARYAENTIGITV